MGPMFTFGSDILDAPVVPARVPAVLGTVCAWLAAFCPGCLFAGIALPAWRSWCRSEGLIQNLGLLGERLGPVLDDDHPAPAYPGAERLLIPGQGAARPGAVGVVGGDRPDAGQGIEDRVRTDT